MALGAVPYLLTIQWKLCMMKHSYTWLQKWPIGGFTTKHVSCAKNFGANYGFFYIWSKLSKTKFVPALASPFVFIPFQKYKKCFITFSCLFYLTPIRGLMESIRMFEQQLYKAWVALMKIYLLPISFIELLGTQKALSPHFAVDQPL